MLVLGSRPPGDGFQHFLLKLYLKNNYLALLAARAQIASFSIKAYSSNFNFELLGGWARIWRLSIKMFFKKY